MDGPPLELPARTAQNLAIAAHELTTNAAKYGALATPGGSIRVEWQVTDGEDGRWLRLDWQERGVALADAPSARGFGMEVIEEMLPYTLGGSSEVAFTPDGVRCAIAMPLPDSGEPPDKAEGGGR